MIVVGKITDKAVVVDGEVVARPVLFIGGTFDHRIIDGFGAGALATATEEFLEDPARFLGDP